ncbi:MAG TPA: glycosyltransferase [Chitinophaga sp.]|uniref:glycosyltransferase n=1 Tax=Chitinophaga sp. TaxID=1869181 RepID=UPI002DBA8C1F|nr:glycosyltransferase [Chitinophaga sp.]HEU4555751.1 glycosyltransferase [Chitinophaga sp.]
MISVIVCSADNSRIEKLKANIAATIGVAVYEILAITNAKELGGICRGYNTGAAQAMYDLLCFVHDDVTFLTPGWGVKAAAHFTQHPRLGLAGLAGSRYKSAAISGWATGQPSFDCCNIFQVSKQGSQQRVYLHPAGQPDDLVPVRTLDGVWLCMRKNVWQEHPFNEEKLPGFHFYDLDISLRVSQHYMTGVVFDIDLLHDSMGSFGEAWINHAIHFHKHINQVPLPAMVPEAAAEAAIAAAEQQVTGYWLGRLMKEPISQAVRCKWIQATGAWKKPAHWRAIAKLLLYPVKKTLERKS